ncbi:ABC transporter ATP-binding protein [Methanoregula sp. PtaB.Bin085]|uniref:ABC transporter ATP-binding protein n=1 Tax=Methanoregula sp. PtaB.Bin085 TaxID=1811680 RepID=UPI0009CA16C5|nr:ATP-binding cassette domain-containing protein [Methanoregula sp. PtaB.Bin085]OPX65757.1 MAG: putative branched-chain amino acid transport ATP-binding protein LivG [Methanoregula sp. PtaB.Bin085]
MKMSSSLARERKPYLLEFQNVTVYHGDIKILDSLSIRIREGENIAILGPNGAGKSSFIKTIVRELYPASGDNSVVFRMHGRDVWDVFELRSTIGIVSNDLQFTFARPLTGQEVILSGFFSSIGLFNRTVTPAMERKADEIFEFLEIEHLKDRPMTAMSTGESRRLLIGRALVHEPKTLILDEPTNSLDLHALHTFRQTLRKVARSGTGIILVTHNLHDIIPEISRVVLMKDGRFCGDGKKAEMLTDEKIGDLFHVPLHVREEGGYYYATGY